MIPAYIIHSNSSTDRESIVQELIQKTGAKVIPACMLENPVLGCTLSHLQVAKIAKMEYPDQPYLVFEDDCILKEDWKMIYEYHTMTKGETDLYYLGYLGSDETNVYGTHALYISPKARDIIIEKATKSILQVGNIGAYDWILSKLSKDYNLTVTLPVACNKYCYQATGLVSLITGSIR